MGRQFGRVFSSFWISEDTRSLSDAAKVLALYLLSGPHSNILGCYRLPDAYVMDDLGWSGTAVAKAYKELLANGFVTVSKGLRNRSETHEWVFIPRYLRWNTVDNPNQATAVLKAFDEVPLSSGLKHLIAQAILEFVPRADPTVVKPFLNGSETLSHSTSPSPDTEASSDGEEKTEAVEENGPVPALVLATPPNGKRAEYPMARRVPDEFDLTPPRLDFATAHGLTVKEAEMQFDTMCDCEFPRAHSDWDAVWRNWVRRHVTSQPKVVQRR